MRFHRFSYVIGAGVGLAFPLITWAAFNGPVQAPPLGNVPGVVWNRTTAGGDANQQTGTEFNIAGSGRLGGDLILEDSKALRIDKVGAASFNIGNWGAGSRPLTVSIFGDLEMASFGPGVGEEGKITAPKFCLNADCITEWPNGKEYLRLDGGTMSGLLEIPSFKIDNGNGYRLLTSDQQTSPSVDPSFNPSFIDLTGPVGRLELLSQNSRNLIQATLPTANVFDQAFKFSQGSGVSTALTLEGLKKNDSALYFTIPGAGLTGRLGDFQNIAGLTVDKSSSDLTSRGAVFSVTGSTTAVTLLPAVAGGNGGKAADLVGNVTMKGNFKLTPQPGVTGAGGMDVTGGQYGGYFTNTTAPGYSAWVGYNGYGGWFTAPAGGYGVYSTQNIGAGGDLVATGKLQVNGNVQTGANIVAPNNTLENCMWETTSLASTNYICSANKIMAGMHKSAAGVVDQMYCCNL